MRVVSIAPFVPFAGIPHAGGQYYFKHVQALIELGHKVTVIAPNTETNAAVAVNAGINIDVHLFPLPHLTKLQELIDRFSVLFNHSRVPTSRVSAFRTDIGVKQLLGNADIIEIQWTQSMSLIPRNLPRPNTPILSIPHDVIYQREERRLQRYSRSLGIRHLLQLFRIGAAKRSERRYAHKSSLVLPFSSKDVALLERIAPQARVEAIHPPLWDDRMVPAAPLCKPRPADTVLFVGALDRDENHQAALWLLTDIWPIVLSLRPQTRLTIAGGGPRPDLLRQAKQSGSVTVTGYVHSLEPYYRQAGVAAIPLLEGAGVKFKAVDALLRGLPVVSTSVGAEGIPGLSGPTPFIIANDAETFASRIVETLAGWGDDAEAEWQHEVHAARIRYSYASFVSGLNHALTSLNSRSSETNQTP